jgi:plasmid stabilization system protein ParE
MTPVFRSPAAERDLEDIWLTIAADNPAAATRIVRAIGARIDRLSEYRGSGRAGLMFGQRREYWWRRSISFCSRRILITTKARSTGSKSCASSMAGALCRTFLVLSDRPSAAH